MVLIKILTHKSVYKIKRLSNYFESLLKSCDILPK
jgi:hypothetical protein